MRILYFILFVILRYPLKMYFRTIKTVKAPRHFFGSTIYVSNHASSFMDPLVIATLRWPIVFFMTRSDVFTTLSKPFLWACHMIPIYRQHDGVDTKNENNIVFKRCVKILKGGRNLLIFGEGFTDDVFIRRLKPVKKGAARIGFYTLEQLNWNKKIYIAAVGCNYTDPGKMRSELLIATSDKICLNDYKAAYLENPNRTINEITKLIELKIKEQITHIENKEMSELHENIMKITKKGMNDGNLNTKIPLFQRWKYSQSLATWMNNQTADHFINIEQLKENLKSYFSELKKLKINDHDIYTLANNQKINTGFTIIKMFFLSPFALLGLLHLGIPYILIKKFVEKTFKRRVFWSSVKLILGMIIMGLINIPVIFLFYKFIYASYGIAFLYYSLIGLFGLAAYMWWLQLQRLKEQKKSLGIDTSELIAKRKSLLQNIEQEIPLA